MIRLIIILSLAFVCAINNTTIAQTSDSFSFESQSQTGDIPGWLTDNGETLTVDGQTFKVYSNNKCGYAVNLRGKYFVYMKDLQGITGETVTIDGKTKQVYQTCKGTPFIFANGSKGLYAKYGKKKTNS